jgi:hypothetical protein
MRKPNSGECDERAGVAGVGRQELQAGRRGFSQKRVVAVSSPFSLRKFTREIFSFRPRVD